MRGMSVRRHILVVLLFLSLLLGGLGYAASSGGTIHVKGHYRKNGTYVEPYTRRAPGSVNHSEEGSSLRSSQRSSGTRRSRTSYKSEIEPRFLSPKTSATRLRSHLGRTWGSSSHFATGYIGARDKHGRLKRSEGAKHAFMRATGYPHGRPGYVIDHVVALKRGGADNPSNMQWQTIAAAKAKDKWE